MSNAYADFQKKYQNVPDGLDLEAAKQAAAGQGWGKEDQGRYDAIMAKRGKAKDRAQTYQQTEGKPSSSTNNQNITKEQTTTVTQSNDQTSSIQGNNNTVTQNQDNSVRNYGGDNRSFTYNGTGDMGKDNVATMGTLSGIWDVDDSPAATASRISQFTTMNRDNQKQYADTSHIAQGAIDRARKNAYIDPAALDKRVQARPQYHRDQATIKGGQIFGDLFGMKGPTWNSPEPAEPVEKPDFDGMFKKYTDF